MSLTLVPMSITEALQSVFSKLEISTICLTNPAKCLATAFEDDQLVALCDQIGPNTKFNANGDNIYFCMTPSIMLDTYSILGILHNHLTCTGIKYEANDHTLTLITQDP